MIPHGKQGAATSSTSSCCTSPLKYQRLLRGWSQQDVANALYQMCQAEGRAGVGINSDQVSRWENGHTLPSPLYRKHLCTLYGLTAEKLGLLAPQEVQHG